MGAVSHDVGGGITPCRGVRIDTTLSQFCLSTPSSARIGAGRYTGRKCCQRAQLAFRRPAGNKGPGAARGQVGQLPEVMTHVRAGPFHFLFLNAGGYSHYRSQKTKQFRTVSGELLEFVIDEFVKRKEL